MQDDTIREVEQFLYREARILDARRFDDWLDLLADDIKYWMPLRSNRYPAYSKAISILDGSRYEEGDISGEDDLAIMDEGQGLPHPPHPASRLRHGLGPKTHRPAPVTSSPTSRSSRAAANRS